MLGRLFMAVVLAALVGCSGSSPTSPSSGNGTGGGYNGGNGGGGTGGGTGGGSTGGNGGNTGDSTGSGSGSGGGVAGLNAAVTVGNIFFKSDHNGSANPAIDTVAVGGTVTWTWRNTGSVPHSIESLCSPAFASSTVETGDGSSYQVRFSVPGTYQYDCAVHGALMSGTIIVR